MTWLSVFSAGTHLMSVKNPSISFYGSQTRTVNLYCIKCIQNNYNSFKLAISTASKCPSRLFPRKIKTFSVRIDKQTETETQEHICLLRKSSPCVPTQGLMFSKEQSPFPSAAVPCHWEAWWLVILKDYCNTSSWSHPGQTSTDQQLKCHSSTSHQSTVSEQESWEIFKH